MFKMTMTAIVAAAAIAMCGQAVAQDCNACGGGYVEAPHVHQHQGNTTCGRSINNHDAAALWTNYCNEDCSQNTCGGGCGLGHGGGCGLGGGCSLGGKLSGMFGGLRNRSCGGDSVCGGESVCGGLSSCNLGSRMGGGRLKGMFGNIGCRSNHDDGCGCDAAPAPVASPCDDPCGESGGLLSRFQGRSHGGCSIASNIGCGSLMSKGCGARGGKLKSLLGKFGNRGGSACGCDSGCFGYGSSCGGGCGSSLFKGQFLSKIRGLRGKFKCKLGGGCGLFGKLKGKFSSSRSKCGTCNAYFGEMVGHEYGTAGMQSAVSGITNECCGAGAVTADPSYGQAEASAEHGVLEAGETAEVVGEAVPQEDNSALQKARDAVEALEDAVNK